MDPTSRTKKQRPDLIAQWPGALLPGRRLLGSSIYFPTCRLIPYPCFGYLILWLGSQSHKVGYPKKDPIIRTIKYIWVYFGAPYLWKPPSTSPKDRANVERTWGFPKIRGTLFRGPYNQDYSIFGSILGSPFFLNSIWKLTQWPE